MVTSILKYKIILIILLVSVPLLLFITTKLFPQSKQSQIINSSLQENNENLVVLTGQSSSSNELFSGQGVTYPADWPAYAKLPQDFIVVEAKAGKLPPGVTGWAIKLRYKGSLEESKSRFVQALSSRGWKIVDESRAPSGKEYSIIIERPSAIRQSAFILDGAAEPAEVLIIGAFSE